MSDINYKQLQEVYKYELEKQSLESIKNRYKYLDEPDKSIINTDSVNVIFNEEDSEEERAAYIKNIIDRVKPLEHILKNKYYKDFVNLMNDALEENEDGDEPIEIMEFINEGLYNKIYKRIDTVANENKYLIYEFLENINYSQVNDFLESGKADIKHVRKYFDSTEEDGKEDSCKGTIKRIFSFPYECLRYNQRFILKGQCTYIK